MSEQQPVAPADAVPWTLVDRAPPQIQPYLRLMRLDRPIGTWLLYWPCVFGLVLGSASVSRPFGSWHDVWLVILLGIGAIVMRGAGCTYNDIVDRDFDAQVARTRGRPIPSGAVSVKQAWLFAAALCLVGLLILLQLNWFAVSLGAASLLLVVFYPFMKRITWWPQAWLGLTFNWGAVLGFAAQTGGIDIGDAMLYAGLFFWTLGYDTIYAHQDKDDDALIGVKSTALLLGAKSRDWILGFYAVAFTLISGGRVYRTRRLALRLPDAFGGRPYVVAGPCSEHGQFRKMFAAISCQSRDRHVDRGGLDHLDLGGLIAIIMAP